MEIDITLLDLTGPHYMTLPCGIWSPEVQYSETCL